MSMESSALASVRAEEARIENALDKDLALTV